MAKKKATKKTPVKKRAVKKSPAVVKATKGAKKKQSSSIANSPIGQLLQGEKICLTGRFNYDPTKPQLEKLIRKLGGKVTEKVDQSLDVLVIGEGKQSKKEKDVEKLNLAGAGIRIVDNAEDLAAGIESFVLPMLTDPKQVGELNSVFEYWLRRNNNYEFTGETFDKVQFGKKAKDQIRIDYIKFMDCSFQSCTFQYIHISDWYGPATIENCEFAACQFDDAELAPKNVAIRDCTGSKLRLADSAGVNFEGTKLNELSFRSAKSVTMKECEVGTFDVSNMYFETFSQADFSNTTIKDLKTHRSFRVEKSSFENVTFSKSEQDDTVQFTKCKFVGVEFLDFNCAELRFEDCDLIDCSFKNCKLPTLDLGKSRVTNCSFDSLEYTFAVVSVKQQKEIKGIDFQEDQVDPKHFRQTKELAKTIKHANKIVIDFEATKGDDVISVSVHADYALNLKHSSKKYKTKKASPVPDSLYHATVDDIHRKLIWLFRAADYEEIIPVSLKTKTSGCKLKPKELKSLIIASAYEVIGKEPISEEEIKKADKESKSKAKESRDGIIEDLKNGNIAKVNRRTAAELKSCSPFRKADLSSLDLKNAKFSDVTFDECNLSKSDLTGAKLTTTNFRKSDLSDANLSGTNLKNTKFRNANLTGANLSKTKVAGTDFTDAILKNTDFSNAVFGLAGDIYYKMGVDLRGIDLSSANLKGATLKQARYDEKTKLPKSITKAQLKSMDWEGGGVPPHERKQNKKVEGPIDFDKFMERVKEITDASRLQKSMKMLKADAFQLFSDIKDSKVVGVVKSQSDANLVYSCSLDSVGNFACCTQNLNPCGGLRGAICKHILVLVLGLTQSGELNAGEVDGWINESKMKSPELDKDEMSEVLLKYKGAEAGEIDWRPTETVPEDFFAF